MKIDFANECWTVHDIQTGATTGEFKHVFLRAVDAELVVTDGGKKGSLVVAGKLHPLENGEAIITSE